MKFFLAKLIIFCFAIVTSGSALGLSDKKTAAIKVAYLYYFSKFVTWPQTVNFNDQQINLCTGNVSEDVAFQLSTVHGKNVAGNKLNVVYIRTEDLKTGNVSSSKTELLLNECHIIYVNARFAGWFNAHSQQAAQHALIVSDSELLGGIDIFLFTQKNKLSFEINDTAVERKGLKISSKLMRLSKRRNG